MTTLETFESPGGMLGTDRPGPRLAASHVQTVERATAGLTRISSARRYDVLCASAVRAYKLRFPDAYIGDCYG
jgi:hypothetical protein